MEDERGKNSDDQMDAGMRLLLKMGYKPGSGLGKREEGRVDPVQATVRSKNTGLGYSEEIKSEEIKFLKKKRSVKIPKQQINSEPEQEFTDRVTDMTGNEPVQISLSQIHTRNLFSKEPDKVQLKLEVILKSISLSVNDGRRECLKLQEQMQLAALLQAQSQQIEESCQQLKAQVQAIIKARQMKRIPLTAVCKLNLPEEAKLCILCERFLECEDVLADLCSDTKARLLQLKWLPVARMKSGCESFEQFCSFSAKWLPHLPLSLKVYFLHSLLYPKLLYELPTYNGDCDCLTSLVMHIDDEDVLGMMRRAVGHAFTSIFGSEYAIAFLQKWKEAFPNDQYLSLSIKHVLPALSKQLSLVIVDPRSQDTSHLDTVIHYLSLVPEPLHQRLFIQSGLIRKLEATFSAWLDKSSVDYGQVAGCYRAWRAYLPQSISLKPLLISIHCKITK